ncbi:DUF6302 family protein [Streptomyces griseoluteus]|uniref:DUF6302 family protein n=1 Tax=Streptomyces griseoluteus TaxID=29306 RepID=UPI00368908E4
MAAYDYEFREARLIGPHLLRDAVAMALHRSRSGGPGRCGPPQGSHGQARPGSVQVLAHVLRRRLACERPLVSDRSVRWCHPLPDDPGPDSYRRFQGLREQPRRPASLRPSAAHDRLNSSSASVTARKTAHSAAGHRPGRRQSHPLTLAADRPAWCHSPYGAAPDHPSLTGAPPHDLRQ